MKKIKLGYAIGTGEEINIESSHLIVTGLTQESGKTTTLESLIKRSKKRAIVFRTKIGEKSFLEGTIIPPYFKDRSDWQFIQGLVEATIKEKLGRFERAKIIQICKKTGGNSLLEFKKRVDERLLEKINSFEMDILTNLQAYLEIVLPKLQSITFSNELDLVEGLNIIDLERFSRDSEVQSLIIRSVAEEVLYNFKDVIIVIPEAWKFLPQGRGNPCKLIIEEFIRQGATNNNLIWIDSQEQTSVDKTPLKQVSTWILGKQFERNEVKHTLEQLPIPKAKKPTADEIMTLGVGEFILANKDQTTKVYVQPWWLDDKTSKEIALGNKKVSEIDAPERSMTPFKVAVKETDKVTEQPTIDFQETSKRFNKELNEMRTDFFDKIADINEQINKVYSELYNLKAEKDSTPSIDEDTIVAKVLQKMPTPSERPSPALGSDYAEIQMDSTMTEEIIKKVLARVPVAGAKVYEIAPLEKIKKDFLEEAKKNILSRIEKLSDEEKKTLKYIEGREVEITNGEIVTKCFILKLGGGSSTKISRLLTNLMGVEVVVKLNSRYKGNLKELIKSLTALHGATDQEIQSVYDHILMEMLK